jgi:hypothetical protein
MPRLQIGIFGTNLTNGTKIINAASMIPGSQEPGDTVYYARPRTVGVRLTAQY